MAPQDDPTADRQPFERSGTIRTWHAGSRVLLLDGTDELVLAAHISPVGCSPGSACC